MAGNQIQDGFRILLHVLCADETQIKCYIYLDFNRMKIIKDIEDHLQSILDIHPVSLFVDDIWLPSCETVHLIKEGDMLFAKLTAVGKIITGSSSKSDVVNDGPVKKKRKPSCETVSSINGNPIISSLDILCKELQNKRAALILKNEKAKLSAPNKDIQNEDDEIFNSVAGKDKRKRIRKHKKKSVIKIAPPRPELISSSNETVSKSYVGKHKRFSDVDVDSSIDLVPVKSAESSKVTDNESECKTNLYQNKIIEEPHSIFIVPEVQELLHSNASADSKLMSIANSSLDSKMDIPTENNENKVALDENTASTQNNSINENRAANEEDWKTKLLSLVAINEKESKIFHRKPVQDVNPDAKTT